MNENLEPAFYSRSNKTVTALYSRTRKHYKVLGSKNNILLNLTQDCAFFSPSIIMSINSIPNNQGEQPSIIHPSIIPQQSEPLPQLSSIYLSWHLYTTKELLLSHIPFKIVMLSVTNQYGKSLKPVQQLCIQNSLRLPVNTDLEVKRHLDVQGSIVPNLVKFFLFQQHFVVFVII